MSAVTSAPLDLIVVNSDGVDIRFAGIELDTAPGHVGDGAGDPSIHLHLSGVRCSETQRRDNQFLRDRQVWSDRRKARGLERSDEDPPQMPGIAVFDQIGIQLTDDLGTEYRRTGGKVAGDGTEWDALWVYVPAPPQNARTLRLEFSVAAAQQESIASCLWTKPLSGRGSLSVRPPKRILSIEDGPQPPTPLVGFWKAVS